MFKAIRDDLIKGKANFGVFNTKVGRIVMTGMGTLDFALEAAHRENVKEIKPGLNKGMMDSRKLTEVKEGSGTVEVRCQCNAELGEVSMAKAKRMVDEERAYLVATHVIAKFDCEC